jgi:hypothetical protein
MLADFSVVLEPNYLPIKHQKILTDTYHRRTWWEDGQSSTTWCHGGVLIENLSRVYYIVD